MLFEWDEAKRRRTVRERGVDVVYAAQMFNGPVLTRIDDREDYGEVRQISVGMVDGECFVIVHTQRGVVTRLNTAWKGGRYERSGYEASLARRHSEDEGGGGAVS